MDWKKITIVCSDTEQAANRLCMLDIYEFEIVDSFEEVKAELDKKAKYWDFIDEQKMRELLGEQRVIVYVPQEDETVLNTVKDGFSGCDYATCIYVDDMDDEDWVNSWKKHFSPIEVGENILVVPCWQKDVPQDKLVIRIDPGMIFGTGSHETTRLCLLEIEKYMKPGYNVLDLGCGSGILAVGAMLLGAQSAHCVDIEENAEKIVKENGALNNIHDIRVTIGDLIEHEDVVAKVKQCKYDFICANIVADVIIAILPLVNQCLKNEGTFVCSGIIDDRVGDVKTALIQNGFNIITQQSEDKWTAFTVCK